MATNNRDVKMTLSVESLGQENIDKLEKSLRTLAKEGGASAEQFGELADEIGRLGQQNQALQAVQKLADGTDQLSQKQDAARTKVQELTERLDVLTRATQDAKLAEQQAAQELLAGQQARVAAGNAIRELNSGYDAAGKRTAEYRTRLQQLTAVQSEANTELVKLRDNNRQAGEAVTEAAQAQSRAETALKRANNEYSKTSTAIDRHNKALQEAGAAAEKLGVDIADLAGAELQLQQSFARATATVQQRKTAMADMAEADRLAAIEAKGMLDLYRQGEQALIQETMALQEAERGARAYEAAKAKALADENAWQKEAYDLVEAAHAAQQLRAESERLANAQRELAAQRAFEAQAEDAKKLLQAAQYVSFWEQELEKAEQQAADTAAAAVTAANRIDTAFRTVGVRSVADVRKEIAEVNTSMSLLASTGQVAGRALSTAMASAETRTKALEREIRELTGQLTLADRAADLFSNSMGQIAAGNLIADGIGSLIEKVKDMGREFISVNLASERLTRALDAIYKSSQTTASQIQFLRNTANDAGVSVGGITDSFVRFSASLNGAGVPLKTTNDLFAAITKAAGTLGLEGERVSLMLDALGQMAAKGVVSMEELRQQLGDSLPGAFSLVAKGLNITEAELVKLVESGQLAARDLFPALTSALRDMHGEIDGAGPAWERFKNTLTLTSQSVGEAGFLKVLTLGIKTLTTAVGVVLVPLNAFMEVVFGIAKTVGVLVGAITTLSNPTEELSKIWSEAGARIDGVNRAFGVSIGLIDSTTNSVRASTAEVAKLTENYSTLSAEQQASLMVRERLLISESAAAQNYVAVSARLSDLSKQQAEHTVILNKALDTAQKEGKVLVETAKLLNDESALRQAQAKAAALSTAATEALLASKRAELAIFQQQKVALEANARANNLTTEQIKQQAEAIEQKIEKSKGEVAQTQAMLALAAREQAVREAAVQILKDQTTTTDQYREAATKAAAEVAKLMASQKEGIDVTKQLAEAEAELAKQTELVRLSQERAATAAKLATESKVQELRASRDILAVEIQLMEQRAETLRGLGLEEQAERLLRDVKLKKIEIARLELEIKREELALSIELNKQKLEEARAEQVLDEQKIKSLEIEQRRLEASSKLLTKQGELLTLQERALKTADATNAAGQKEVATRTQVTQAINTETEAREKSIAAREKEIELQEREDELYRKRWNMDKNNRTLDNNGNVLQQSMPSTGYIIDEGRSQGLSDAQLKALIDQFLPGGQARVQGPAWFQQVNKAISQMRVDNLSAPATTTQAPTTSSTTTPAPAPAAAGVSRGRSMSVAINVVGEQDARNLRQVLSILETEGGRAA